MADKPVPLTREGKSRLEQELDGLRARRRAVAERLHASQEQGTSQNDAEYDDAKLEQGMVEGRVLEIEDILRRATVLDQTGVHRSGRVVIGSGVEVEQDGKQRSYQIVSAPEADAAHGRISSDSPVGAALLGRAAGDFVDVNAPRGVVKLKILKID